jgi:hypothetical protein
LGTGSAQCGQMGSDRRDLSGPTTQWRRQR